MQEVSPRMNSDALFRDELHRAIYAHELELYYQPKINLRSMSLCGAEALIRWQHPQRGLLMPGDFVRQAESCGTIAELGYWVLSTAIHQLRKWLDVGWRTCIAVNVSPTQLIEVDFVSNLKRMLRQANVPPTLLEIEITEGTQIQHESASAHVLCQIRDLGIHLSLDDFGTAYSSLKYLKMFGVDSIKLDQFFIQRINTHPRAYDITQSVVQLGHRLGIRVVAEGVESCEQLKAVHECRCDEVQGFYFSPPVTVLHFEERFLRRNLWSNRLDFVSESNE